MKENPPITENMVRAMMNQMGRTPSQKQVNQVMKTLKNKCEELWKKRKKYMYVQYVGMKSKDHFRKTIYVPYVE